MLKLLLNHSPVRYNKIVEVENITMLYFSISYMLGTKNYFLGCFETKESISHHIVRFLLVTEIDFKNLTEFSRIKY